MDTATLIAGHRAITDASRAMLAALAATPVDVNAVARHRMTLSLRVRQQLRDEDRVVLPVLRAGGLASLPLAVRDLVDRRALLMRRYSEHVARWTLQALSADIPCFHRGNPGARRRCRPTDGRAGAGTLPLYRFLAGRNVSAA